MIDIDLRSRTPIYEQIKEQIMLLIQLGILKPHEQLPSIRELSKQLGLNVNTVKRAFSSLAHDGVIYSLPGRGSYIMENAFANSTIKKKAISELSTAMFSGKTKGISYDEALNLLTEIYNEEGQT